MGGPGSSARLGVLFCWQGRGSPLAWTREGAPTAAFLPGHVDPRVVLQGAVDHGVRDVAEVRLPEATRHVVPQEHAGELLCQDLLRLVVEGQAAPGVDRAVSLLDDAVVGGVGPGVAAAGDEEV